MEIPVEPKEMEHIEGINENQRERQGNGNKLKVHNTADNDGPLATNLRLNDPASDGTGTEFAKKPTNDNEWKARSADEATDVDCDKNSNKTVDSNNLAGTEDELQTHTGSEAIRYLQLSAPCSGS